MQSCAEDGLKKMGILCLPGCLSVRNCGNVLVCPLRNQLVLQGTSILKSIFPGTVSVCDCQCNCLFTSVSLFTYHSILFVSSSQLFSAQWSKSGLCRLTYVANRTLLSLAPISMWWISSLCCFSPFNGQPWRCHMCMFSDPLHLCGTVSLSLLISCLAVNLYQLTVSFWGYETYKLELKTSQEHIAEMFFHLHVWLLAPCAFCLPVCLLCCDICSGLGWVELKTSAADRAFCEGKGGGEVKRERGENRYIPVIV